MTDSWDELWRVLLLRDYNTRVVMLGVMMLGAAGGMAGTFLLLRKRSLLSDSISHACLPGIVMAFLMGHLLGGDGKNLGALLIGAALSGLAGVLAVSWMRRFTGVKEDAALAIVLSVFFGLGVVLLTLVQQLPSGNAAGLQGFIFGKAASMTTADAWLTTWLAGVVLLAVVLLRKEWTLLCFDEAFAQAQGWPARILDLGLMMLVLAATVIGLQAVGLLLVVALLIVPPASARFWSDRLDANLALAAVIGALSGGLGVLASAMLPRMPAGAMIVMAALLFFLLSMAFGPARGLVHRWLEYRKMSLGMERQHVLRAVYEVLEARDAGEEGEVEMEDLLARRAWSERQLDRALNRLESRGLAVRLEGGRVRLTQRGWHEARRVTRNHRLWELYLIHYADTAPGVVDREADAVEHVVGLEMVRKLEGLMQGEDARRLPPSPHVIGMESESVGGRKG